MNDTWWWWERNRADLHFRLLRKMKKKECDGFIRPTGRKREKGSKIQKRISDFKQSLSPDKTICEISLVSFLSRIEAGCFSFFGQMIPQPVSPGWRTCLLLHIYIRVQDIAVGGNDDDGSGGCEGPKSGRLMKHVGINRLGHLISSAHIAFFLLSSWDDICSFLEGRFFRLWDSALDDFSPGRREKKPFSHLGCTFLANIKVLTDVGERKRKKKERKKNTEKKHPETGARKKTSKSCRVRTSFSYESIKL